MRKKMANLLPIWTHGELPNSYSSVLIQKSSFNVSHSFSQARNVMTVCPHDPTSSGIPGKDIDENQQNKKN